MQASLVQLGGDKTVNRIAGRTRRVGARVGNRWSFERAEGPMITFEFGDWILLHICVDHGHACQAEQRKNKQ